MRLIDADEREKYLQEVYDTNPKRIYGDLTLHDAIEMAMDWIDSAPTVDAEPIKHGHWIHPKSGWTIDGHLPIICSECGFKERSTIDEYDRLYCPHCGAKMDK